MQSKNKLEIVGIKTKQGYFISDKAYTDYGETYLHTYSINGDKPTKTFHRRWVLTKDEPKTIQSEQRQQDINYRYELIDKSLASDKFPLVLNIDDVAWYDSDEYEWIWTDEYKHLRSLYELKSDKQPNILVDVEFEYETILEMDEIKEVNGFSYPVQKTQWRHEGLVNLTEKDVKHRLIDKMAFPDVVLPQLPCQLTSKQMYNIVREYIKDKINPEVAMIKSDYDFCFEVHKKIELENPYSVKNEIRKSNGRSYAKPRYNTKFYKVRTVKVFEMTHAERGYENYTPIAGISAENLEELQSKVDKYLHNTIEMINTPLKECPCCSGYGVELTEDVKRNLKINLKSSF